MGFHLQGCAFSTHFSHLSWFPTVSSKSFSQKDNFLILYCVCMQSCALAVPTGPWCITFAPKGLKNLRHHPPNAFLICLKHVHFALLCTLIQWVLSKTHQFENALETGWKQKNTHIMLVWMFKQDVCIAGA